jgi:hypothetical protein
VPTPTIVISTSTLPLWAPDRTQVADYVPGRTLSQDLNGARLTFDATTRPTGDEVDRLIAEATTWVMLKTGTAIAANLLGAATTAAAIRTAGMVELGYPRNAKDLDTAQILLKQASDLRDDLARANAAATGEDPTDPAENVLPVWHFPPAPHHHSHGRRSPWDRLY